MADADNSAENPAAGKGKRPIAMIAAIGGFVIVAAGTVGFLMFPKGGGHAEEVHEAPKARSLMPIPQILVNLSENRSQRLLQATMSIEAQADTESEISDRFNADLPKIQDLLIKVLSAYTSEDLEGSINKEAVQARLVRALNDELFAEGSVSVTGVFFTEFVVQ